MPLSYATKAIVGYVSIIAEVTAEVNCGGERIHHPGQTAHGLSRLPPGSGPHGRPCWCDIAPGFESSPLPSHSSNTNYQMVVRIAIAEARGFEPLIPFGILAFQASALVPGLTRTRYPQSGGERIRTSDTFRYTRFPSERTRPLCDASALRVSASGNPLMTVPTIISPLCDASKADIAYHVFAMISIKKAGAKPCHGHGTAARERPDVPS